MNEIITNVISIVVTAIVIPLISYLGFKLSQWISQQIKNDKEKALLNKANDIVMTAVKSVFQTYVESLKEADTFTVEAQQAALNRARAIVASELTTELKDFIKTNYGDLANWLTNAIEASIYQLKN